MQVSVVSECYESIKTYKPIFPTHMTHMTHMTMSPKGFVLWLLDTVWFYGSIIITSEMVSDVFTDKLIQIISYKIMPTHMTHMSHMTHMTHMTHMAHMARCAQRLCWGSFDTFTCCSMFRGDLK